MPLALRFDDDDESMGKHSDDDATEPEGKQKENKALRDSFSGRFRRRAREPLPLHELIDPKGVPDDQPEDEDEDEDDGRRLPVGDMVSAIEAVEREDANRATAAAGFAKGSSPAMRAFNSSSDEDENVVRKSVEELRASLPRLRTSPVERTRETPVEAAVTSSGENAEAESETKFEPDATWPPLPEDMPSDDEEDEDEEEEGGDGIDANGEKEEKEQSTTPAVTTCDDEDATANAVRASIDAAVTHVEVELQDTAEDVDETVDETAVKVDATEPNAPETCTTTDGPILSSEPSTLRSSQGGMTTGGRSSTRSSASSKGLRASLKKRRGRARRIIAAIAERTKRASLATSTNTSTKANAKAEGAEGADTAVPRMEVPEPPVADTLAKADTDCPSDGLVIARARRLPRRVHTGSGRRLGRARRGGRARRRRAPITRDGASLRGRLRRGREATGGVEVALARVADPGWRRGHEDDARRGACRSDGRARRRRTRGVGARRAIHE